MNAGFELLNGKAVGRGEPLFNSGNRAFRYGDGFFETMKFRNGKLLYSNDHLTRITRSLEFLDMKWPEQFSFDELESMILDQAMLQKFSDARARLTIFRNGDGLYLPVRDETAWHLSVEEISSGIYEEDGTGISVILYEENRKAHGMLSNLKTTNCLVYVLASKFAKSYGKEDALLMNTRGHIIESSNSNIFTRFGDMIKTPPLSDGCLDGVMRKNVMRIMNLEGFVVTEASLLLEEIKRADEIMLTNVITGARWVQNFEGKIYSGELTSGINRLLNVAMEEIS